MHDVLSIKFSNSSRIYYFDPGKGDYKVDDLVILETEKGLQIGTVVAEKHSVDGKKLYLPLKKVLRKADKEDRKQYEENIKESKEALERARKLVKELDLDMRIYDATYTFDRNQLVFSFIADGRVDFRELARKLAYIYKTRIELRQIGVRDKAREVGGIGPCGRFLCCNSFLKDFDTVSINMAKNQYLALNPSKINGLCGRLLCCLNYENEQYNEMKKGLPKVGESFVVDNKKAKVISVDIFSGTYLVEKEDKTYVTLDADKK